MKKKLMQLNKWLGSHPKTVSSFWVLSFIPLFIIHIIEGNTLLMIVSAIFLAMELAILTVELEKSFAKRKKKKKQKRN